MFADITPKIAARMRYLEALDRADRADGTPISERLRQIGPEVGKFLALLASNCPDGEFLEIGTSAGYSSLWMSLAARSRGKKLKTFEILPGKIKLAKETFTVTSSWDAVELIEGDFLEMGSTLKHIAFCFLDCDKDLYRRCFDLVAPRMVPHGLLIADNVISHQNALQPLIDEVTADDRFDSLVVPIGNGELVCRRR
jgi:caffeoyl-CoA O-methyltransferase